jgi:hypothetical protein
VFDSIPQLPFGSIRPNASCGAVRRINPFEHFNIVMLATAIFFLAKKATGTTVYFMTPPGMPGFSKDVSTQSVDWQS